MLLFGGIGFCAYSAYRGFKDFPDYARKEVVYKKYDVLLKSIDECVLNSDTALSLAVNLEKMKKPDELLYLALEKKDDFSSDNANKIEIIKRYEGRTSSITIINGSGYGRLDDKEIIIIEYDIKKYDDVKSCIIYLEHKSL